eukprot:5621168-Prymnesium_polylepis.1
MDGARPRGARAVPTRLSNAPRPKGDSLFFIFPCRRPWGCVCSRRRARVRSGTGSKRGVVRATWPAPLVPISLDFWPFFPTFFSTVVPSVSR